MSEIRDAYFKEIDDLAHNFIQKVREQFPNNRMYLSCSPDSNETFWLHVEGLETDEFMTGLIDFCHDKNNVGYLDIFPDDEFKNVRYEEPEKYGLIV